MIFNLLENLDGIHDSLVAAVAKEWNNTAGSGEFVNVQILGTTIYGFGSEQACLNIYNKLVAAAPDLNTENTIRINFSSNRNAWYIAFDMEK